MAYLAIANLTVEIELIYACGECELGKTQVFDYIKKEILNSQIQDKEGRIKILASAIKDFDVTVVRDDLVKK